MIFDIYRVQLRYMKFNSAFVDTKFIKIGHELIFENCSFIIECSLSVDDALCRRDRTRQSTKRRHISKLQTSEKGINRLLILPIDIYSYETEIKKKNHEINSCPILITIIS